MKRAGVILAGAVVAVALVAVAMLVALAGRLNLNLFPVTLALISGSIAIVLSLLALCFRAGLAADRIGWMSSSGGRVRAIARFLLPTSNTLAVLAALVGLAAGFLLATLGAGLTCFDSCPTSNDYFARLAPSTFFLSLPCLALEGLALVALVAYHAAKRQPRRALTPALILMLGNLLGVAALTALYWQGQSSLPVTPDGLLAEDQVTRWGFGWGLLVMVVAIVPSMGFASAQWVRWMV